VTLPATVTHLDSFTFYVDAPANLLFRDEVYAWATPVSARPDRPCMRVAPCTPAGIADYLDLVRAQTGKHLSA
jgi:hypothetical protein